MRKVDKAEFDEFIKSYPNQIEKNVHTIVEPPYLAFYDMSLPTKAKEGEWEYLNDKKIAGIILGYSMKGEPDKNGEFYEYSIKEK